MFFLNKSTWFPVVWRLAVVAFMGQGQAALWPQRCDLFVADQLQDLRNTRIQLGRPVVPFGKAVEVLDFVVAERNVHGLDALSATPHLADLMVDICDIVNLQHPNFKTRYDIFIEQWDGKNQLPFSLFSFDRIAQVFHDHQTLFSVGPGSAYREMVEGILQDEIPLLRELFVLIRDLNTDPILPAIQAIKDDLDQIQEKHSKDKAAAEKALKGKIPNARMKKLTAISAMAHDYLTLGRLEEVVTLVMGIPDFTTPTQREAFLAGMIQIGELATNKNLSSYAKHHMPTIPWEDLVYCRDALEHQDERGIDAYFKGLIDGRNTLVSFKEWQKELGVLKTRIAEGKNALWQGDHKTVFEEWLRGESVGAPIYGVIIQKPTISFGDKKGKSAEEKKADDQNKKAFRQTSVFNTNTDLWKGLMTATVAIDYSHLNDLGREWEKIKDVVDGLSDLKDKEKQEKPRQTKFMNSYQAVESYLWNRLAIEAIHLTEGEQETLIDMAKTHFGIPAIANLCLALLKKDQGFLTAENWKLFFTSVVVEKLDASMIPPIFKKFRPDMPIMRQAATAIPCDDTQNLSQPDRRNLAQDMFARTTDHLHDLAHGPDFEKRLFQEILTIPTRYAFEQGMKKNRKVRKMAEEIGKLHKTQATVDEYGYANLNPEGQAAMAKIVKKGPFLKFPEIAPDLFKFGREVVNRLYRTGHQVHLPSAIKNNPVTYLASVYSLSVGLGALKGWVLKENGAATVQETAAVEKLRDGRNFMAHGDLLRTMHNIQLADVLGSMLEGHLDHCQTLFVNLTDAQLAEMMKKGATS